MITHLYDSTPLSVIKTADGESYSAYGSMPLILLMFWTLCDTYHMLDDLVKPSCFG